jgi:sulfite oxidase
MIDSCLELQKPNQPYNRVWSWTLWTADIPVPKDVKGDFKICVKATDSSYNTQPEKVAHIWNLRGVLCNSWHCINVQKNPK